MQQQPSSFSPHAHALHATQHSTRAAESPNNLTIIPALQGDGSILLPFVSCHLAMLIMQKPPLSTHSVGIHTAVHFQADNYPGLLHKRRRTISRILCICDAADRLALSRQWSSPKHWHFSFSVYLSFSHYCWKTCLTKLRGMQPAVLSDTEALQGNRPKSFFMAWWETLRNRPTWSHECMRDGTQHAIGVYTQLTKIDRKTDGFWCVFLSEVHSLLLPPPKPSRPIPVKCSAGRNSQCRWLGPCSDHQWSPRQLHVSACRKGLNTTMQAGRGGHLTSSAVHHIKKIPSFASTLQPGFNVTRFTVL